MHGQNHIKLIIIQWLLPVVFAAVVFQVTGLVNHSTKYHRQQPLYNTFELLIMGIVVPETC